MANPQPDVFFKWSKELWKAIIKWKFTGRTRQVFDAIAYLTYGQFPPVKERQISGEMLMELTGLNKWQTSHALKELLDMNLVAKNRNYYPVSIRINKDYESWKELRKTATPSKIKASQGMQKNELRKTATRVAKNRNSSKMHLLYIKNKDLSDSVYEFYKNQISPLRKSASRAKENITYYLKKYSPEDLKKAIENYASTLNGTDPQFRKDPANFFGKNDRYFIDFLPGNFEPHQDNQNQPRGKVWTRKELKKYE